MSEAGSDHHLWLEYVEDDYRSMQMHAEKGPSHHCAFFAQQCAEKYLKAFLSFRGSEVRKTHSLGSLLAECSALTPSLAVLAEDCRRLSPFAVAPRYPGFSKPDSAEITKIVAAAERIRERLRKEVSRK